MKILSNPDSKDGAEYLGQKDVTQPYLLPSLWTATPPLEKIREGASFSDFL